MRDYDIESDLKQEKFQSLKLVQGDRGNKIKINVYEDGQPVNLAGCSVTAKYKRADGEVVDGIVENKTDNYFYAVMDNNITKVAGTLKMLFNIENGDVKVSTFLLLADVREGIGENTGSSGGDTEVTVDLKDYQKKTDNGLETKNKYIVGAINEVNSQCKDIVNLSLTKHTDGKVYIKKQDGTLIGDGIEISGSDVDLSKITMSMDNQTLKLMNDGTQIATVEIPTAVVTDEQLTSIIQSKIDDGTLGELTLSDDTKNKLNCFTLKNLNLLNVNTGRTNGYYSNSTGEWVNDTQYSNSDYISVNPNENYIKNWNSQITFWNESKEFVSGTVSNSGASFTIPNNTNIKYMTVNYVTKNKDNLILVLGNSIPANLYYLEEIDSISNSINTMSNDIQQLRNDIPEGAGIKLGCVNYERVNLFYKEKATKGGYYSNSTGKWVVDNNYYSTDFIEVNINEIYIKNKGSQITFWNESKEFVSGTVSNSGASFTIPNNINIKYMKSSIYYKDIDNIMIFKGKELPSNYHNYELKELIDINKKIKNVNSELENRIKKPMKYIECTVANETQMTHPSILYFQNKFNGYTYWMAVTPYPNADDKKENPSIIVSNDLINWVEPSGISNPIVSPSSNNAYYNSDCELVYNSDNEKLECWYRKVNRNPYKETICRKTSSDGVTWTDEEILFEKNTLAEVLSPCVMYKNSKYMIWVNNNTNSKIEYYESNTGNSWTKIRDITINGIGENIKHPWHMSIKATVNGYEMYFVTGFLENGYKPNMLYYCYSTDNVTYTTPVEVLSATPFSNEDELYRPSFCDTNDGNRNKKRIIVYGVISNTGEWYINIGYTHIKIPFKLVKIEI